MFKLKLVAIDENGDRTSLVATDNDTHIEYLLADAINAPAGGKVERAYAIAREAGLDADNHTVDDSALVGGKPKLPTGPVRYFPQHEVPAGWYERDADGRWVRMSAGPSLGSQDNA